MESILHKSFLLPFFAYFFIIKQFYYEHKKEKFYYQSEQLGHSLYNFATPLKSLAFLGTKCKMLVEWRSIFL